MKSIMVKVAALLFSVCCWSAELQSKEAKVVLSSTVTGNQEQPKVLYIVPWQQAQSPELIYQPLQSLVDGVFEEIDRQEFLRELRYLSKINTTKSSSP